MMKTLSFLARLYNKIGRRPYLVMVPVVIFAIAYDPGTSQAKGGDDQTQIILLNDSAAALEDSDPGLSKNLAKFADEKEKEWEDENARKDGLPPPVTSKDLPRLREQIKLLNAAALAIQPVYPLIAKSLVKMAKDINRKIEIEE